MTSYPNALPVWEMVLVVVGLALISALSRSFFFLTRQEWSLPPWVERALRHAPLAALAAVIAPDLLLTAGHFHARWDDPRWPAAAVAVIWAIWRKGMLGTICVGMAVFLALQFGLGWAV